MILPGPDLPDDVDALKAMIIALNAEKAATDAEIARMKAVQQKADERITNLTAILKVLQRAQKGTRSERLRLAINDDQIDFAFEEIEAGLAAIDRELGQAGKDRPKREARPRKGFAAHLERIEEVIEPEIPEECQGLEKILIGEDRSERLDVIPPKFRVIITRRPKYAFRERDGVLQALAPAHIIEAGLPSERLLAYIAVSKYADGLPLYRQEAIYLRDSVVLSRSLMAQWMGHLGFELRLLSDYILERIKASERIFADETTLPTLVPGFGKTMTAWLWAYACDNRPFGGSGPPMVAYRFEVSRGGKCVARHLEGFSGILQVDGYSAYTSMLKERAKSGSNETIKLAGCWAHVRRKFYELHVGGINDAATASITAMTGLWKIEDEIRGSDAETRARRHQETSAAIVANLFQLWEKELSKVSGKSKTAEAIRYALTRREALEHFLTDGRIEIDPSIVERAIRPQTITRKNSLFAGSEGGGETWATIATLLQTAKLNNVDPLAWLSQTLTRIANRWPAADIEQLMPWNFKADAIG